MIKFIDLGELWVGVYGAVVTVPEALPLRNLNFGKTSFNNFALGIVAISVIRRSDGVNITVS